jgi:SAM-dependent methyltransferase
MEGDRPYLDPYLKAAEDFGPGFEALLWQSPKAQRLRFRAIAQMAPVEGRVLADIGCGNADLLTDLHRRGRAPAGYLGVDAVPATLAHARAQVRDAGIGHARFFGDDFVRDEGLAERLVAREGADTVVFCGSLNTLPQPEAVAILARFWGALRAKPDGALVFNFLSDRHDRARTPAAPPAVRFDAVDMVHWALDQTPLVTFRHDYLGGHDATVCMRVGRTAP